MATVVAQEEQPISRTYQYRKVMKPMLERKRRARINRCLDELKELLVGALQAEGESVSRLEKADVLEHTVRHLHKLRRAQQLSENSASDRFRAGFSHCANEVTKYMSTLTSSIDITVSSRLLNHLDSYIQSLGGVVLPISSPQQTNPHNGSSPIPVPHPINSPNTMMGHPGHMHHMLPHHPSGLNVLTNYTPPSSPVSSPNNPKVLVYNSPSPAHIQTAFGNGVVPMHHQNTSPQPLSLCTKEEPFDLSSGSVWRPW